VLLALAILVNYYQNMNIETVGAITVSAVIGYTIGYFFLAKSKKEKVVESVCDEPNTKVFIDFLNEGMLI